MKAMQWLRKQSGLFMTLTALGLMAGLMISFWLLFSVVRPAPPRTVTMMTGSPGGGYAMFGELYRAALAREGIDLVLLPSAGSIDNLRGLKTEGVDLAFLQSGVAYEPDSRDLVSLGSMYFEPVWVFHRLNKPLTRLSQINGYSIAIGDPGSATQLLALQILSSSGVALNNPGLKTIGGNEAAAALLDGSVDAAFIISGAESPVIQSLLSATGIHIAELEHTAAYTKRIPHLETTLLPAGAVDLVNLSPPRDVHLLGASANLVARADLHPAIISLLLQSAREIHAAPGLFQRAGEYPKLTGRDLPPSDVAQRLYSTGPPFLQRYLPFWLAILVDRLLVALIPLIALMIPLMRVLPAVYSWRMRSRIYRWYGEMKFLEEKIAPSTSDEEIAHYLEQLDHIEDQANHRRIPLSYNSELYTLREHIQLIREKLFSLRRSRSKTNRI
jgi:TRAP transporter TAXI family solute receptor